MSNKLSAGGAKDTRAEPLTPLQGFDISCFDNPGLAAGATLCRPSGPNWDFVLLIRDRDQRRTIGRFQTQPPRRSFLFPAGPGGLPLVSRQSGCIEFFQLGSARLHG